MLEKVGKLRRSTFLFAWSYLGHVKEAGLQKNHNPFSRIGRILMAVSRSVEWFFDVQNIGREGFWEGRAKKTCNLSSILYLLVTFGALFVYSFSHINSLSDIKGWGRLLPITIGAFVSAGPPAFFWVEARAFDQWLNAKVQDVENQKKWRETYKLNADNGKAFWAAILAVYAAVLLKW